MPATVVGVDSAMERMDKDLSGQVRKLKKNQLLVAESFRKFRSVLRFRATPMSYEGLTNVFLIRSEPRAERTSAWFSMNFSPQIIGSQSHRN